MKIGVSECLTGVKCRYDGSHARDDFVTKVLAEYAEFVPFCPEAAVLGTPRETMRFVRFEDGVKLVGNASGSDYTAPIRAYSLEAAERIRNEGLCGFVFKAKSPSCGVERVKIYTEGGMPAESADGLFARTVQEALPYLPVEDEKRLLDAWLRENFILHIFAYERYMTFAKTARSMKELVDFHSRHKFLLQSKHEGYYRELGSIVANHDKLAFEAVMEKYGELFLKTIAQKNSRGAAVNVLEHMYGFVKKLVSDEEKQLFLKTLGEFREGVIPMIAVLKLLEHFVVLHNVEYIKNQVFLDPYPAKLGLRSDIKAYR